MKKLVEMAQVLLRDLKRSLEENYVQVMGQVCCQQASARRQKVMDNGKKELKAVQSFIDTSTEELSIYIEGKFGEKVKKVFDEQKHQLKSY